MNWAENVASLVVLSLQYVSNSNLTEADSFFLTHTKNYLVAPFYY